LTANASRALISDQTINNRQVASWSSSFVAMRRIFLFERGE
jgi:hypothetical protein